MKFKQRSKAGEGIPSSSMADIAFLLIIFFMVTTAFSAKKGIDFQLPREQEDRSPEETHAILVDIDPSGRMIVDGQPFNLEELRPYVESKVTNNPNKFVIIKTDDEAPYGSMIDVLDELKQVDNGDGTKGIKNVAIPTKEEIAAWGEG